MTFTVDHLLALLSVIAEQQLRIAQLQAQVNAQDAETHEGTP